MIDRSEHSDLASVTVASEDLLRELEAKQRRLDEAIERLENQSLPHDTVDFERAPKRYVERLRTLVQQDRIARSNHIEALKAEKDRVCKKIELIQLEIATTSHQIVLFTTPRITPVSTSDQQKPTRKLHKKKPAKGPHCDLEPDDPKFFANLHPEIQASFHLTNPFEREKLPELPPSPSENAQVVGGVVLITRRGVQTLGHFSLKST